MPVKMNHYYTIVSKRSEDYGKFMVNEFIPGINELKLNMVAGWSVLVGSYSETIFESVSSDLLVLEEALRSPKYRQLNANLLNYVKSYKTKVLVSTGKVESYTTEFTQDSIKFNQTWDIISEKKADLDKFTVQEFYPCLEELGIKIAAEWEVLIGDSPHYICEGRVKDVSQLLRGLQSEKFRNAKKKLRGFIENYQSRILSIHILKGSGKDFPLITY